MPIESGTTSWWRNRNLMFLGMLLAFAAYFAYDGFYGWPNTNLEWAVQAMGERPADLRPNPKVWTSELPKIQADLASKGSMTFEQCMDIFRAHLGEPALVRKEKSEYWWVGPGIYMKPSVRDGKFDFGVVPSTKHSESSIRGQRWCALLLVFLGGLAGLNLVRIVTTKIVLDDSGLRYNRRHLSWEAMTGLRTQDYDRKYWVDLEYTAGDVTRSIRLDSFHIDKFKEIVSAICERKGFACPDLTSTSKDTVEDAGSPQA